MLTISHRNLWAFLNESLDEEEQTLFDRTVSAEDKAALANLDIRQVCVDFSMSENHMGGDDICDIVHDTLEAVKAGYEIIVWYGDDTEVLIVGVRPGQINLV